MRNHPFHRSAVRFALFIIFILFCFFISKYFRVDDAAFRSSLAESSFGLAALIFILSYITLTFFIWVGPKDILRLVAAVLYGPYVSSALVYAAEMLNAAILFSFSRRMGREYIETKLRGKFKNFDAAVAERSLGKIFLLRFLPLIPLRFLDLAFGLSRIPLKRYLAICLFATPLRIFFTQFYLSLGLDVVSDPRRLSIYLQEHPAALLFSFLYVLGAIVFLLFIRKKK